MNEQTEPMAVVCPCQLTVSHTRPVPSHGIFRVSIGTDARKQNVRDRAGGAFDGFERCEAVLAG